MFNAENQWINYRLELGNHIDPFVSKRHQAWLIDGFNILDRLLSRFAGKDPEYKPEVIGFYDDINWELRNGAICRNLIFCYRRQ